MDFTYERIKFPDRLKVEIVTGGEEYKGTVGTEIARQIYCENGKDGYRDLGHFKSGAPFLFNSDERISISHTRGCFVVATIPVEPTEDLSIFSPSTALGVDVEKADRAQCLKVAPRFLTAEEIALMAPESLGKAVTAWTCKEAMLKAVLNTIEDWHHNILIDSLPEEGTPGVGHVVFPDSTVYFSLIKLKVEEFIITVARVKTSE